MLTPHSQFRAEPNWEAAKLLVDTRNALPNGPNVWRI